MHTHLLCAAFQVAFISPYFLMGNAAGVAVQISRLYNSGMERLKKEEDWSHVQLAFTCDLWKLAMNKECCMTLHTAQSHTHSGCRGPKPKELEENELQR